MNAWKVPTSVSELIERRDGDGLCLVFMVGRSYMSIECLRHYRTMLLARHLSVLAMNTVTGQS